MGGKGRVVQGITESLGPRFTFPMVFQWQQSMHMASQHCAKLATHVCFPTLTSLPMSLSRFLVEKNDLV